MKGIDFDVLIHDWIPCLKIEGTPNLYSLRSALENATEVRSIEHESPPVRIAMLRLLLALCYRIAFANGVPIQTFRNWKKLREIWKEGVPPQWIDHYLDNFHCRDRFRLFDDNYPFFQVAGLECQGDKQPEPGMRLAFEQFGGKPSSLWEHLPEMPSVAQTALYLVTCQAFGASTSNTSNARVGLLDYSPTGRTFTPTYKGYIVWPEGESLLKTLLLNLVDYDLTNTDLPIWEKPLNIKTLRARQPRKAEEGDLDENGNQIKIGKKLDGYKEASPTGPVQLFTWPSRAVLLSKPENKQVKAVHFTQGLALRDHPDDPMKSYNREGKSISFQPHKAGWRDLHAILAIGPNQNRTVQALSHAARSGSSALRINIAGIARGDEAAKILFWRHERMSLPAEFLGDINLIERLGSLLKCAESIGSELRIRAKRTAKLYLAPESEKQGGRKPDKKDVENLADEIDPRPAYWARLEKHFFELLVGLPSDWDNETEDWKPDDRQSATNLWRKSVKQEAERALEESIRSLGITARAIQAIARVGTEF